MHVYNGHKEVAQKSTVCRTSRLVANVSETIASYRDWDFGLGRSRRTEAIEMRTFKALLRFGVLTAVTMKKTVVCDVTPYSLEDVRMFRRNLLPRSLTYITRSSSVPTIGDTGLAETSVRLHNIISQDAIFSKTLIRIQKKGGVETKKV